METVILFGKGRYFDEKKATIFRNYNVREIWDSSIEKGRNSKYEGIPVINPMDAELDGKEKIFLLSVRFIGMWKYLMERGIEPERLVLPFFMKNTFENDEALSKCIRNITFQRTEIRIIDLNNKEYVIHDEEEWRIVLRIFYSETYPIIRAISAMKTVPVSNQFGTERGLPIDRYYIEKFLNDKRHYIQGTVLEIEDNTYTKQFGNAQCQAIVMDVSSKSEEVNFVANLETGEGIKDNIADCFILTQTLMYLYSTKKVAENIYRLLKMNGVALITCSGISQNSRRCMDEYGCTFNYNIDAFKHMFSDSNKFEILDIGSFGNVKTVCAHLAGLCQEDLEENDFDINDKYYPLIVYAAIRRVS